MNCAVLVLTAPDKSAAGSPVTDAIVAAVAAALNALGANVTGRRWLNLGIACELSVEGADNVRCTSALAEQFVDAPVDVVAVPAADRRKALLVADMDSTIITGETLDELAELAGIGPVIADITRRAMNGEIAFADALSARLDALRGVPEAMLEETWRGMRLTPGATTLVATMRANGAYTVLVSGGFTFFTDRVAKAAGFDAVQANRLDIADGRLTGGTVGPVMGPEGKLAALESHAAARGLPLSAALATGDGANDIPMLQAAGLGVAFHPRPLVAATIGTAVRHGDLTALLYLQGYRAEEFAT